MRAVKYRSGQFEVTEVPSARGDGVRIHISAAGICGSDLLLAAYGASGYVVGHEMSGVTEEGAAVVIEPSVWCGGCEECRAGHTQRCQWEGHGTLGIFRDGGMSDEIVVQAKQLLPVPVGLDVRDACLVEPASIAFHGVRRAGVRPGERVAVVGGGTIGLLTAAVLVTEGVAVDVVARHEHQLVAATRLGASTGPRGAYDVVIDAAGSESGIVRCAELVRPGGRIVILGVYVDKVPLPAQISLTKEITYINSIVYGRTGEVREFEQVAALLAANPVIPATIITHRFPMANAAAAFSTAADRSAGAIKVVVEP